MADAPDRPPRYLPRPATRTETAVLLLLCAGIVAVYVLLATLTPDPRGYGTHEQLGWDPCGWPRAYGIPCPTCGVTTSAVLLLHGRPAAALWTSPFGALLAVAGAAFVVFGVRHALRGESFFARLATWPWLWIVLGALAVLLASWAWVTAHFA